MAEHLFVKDLERAIEKLEETGAQKPYKLFIAHENFLHEAVDYFSDSDDVVVCARDGRRFRGGKELGNAD